MKIKKIGILMIAGTLMCTSPAATVMASDATETVQEIIQITRLILWFLILIR